MRLKLHHDGRNAFPTGPRLALGPSQSCIQWFLGFFYGVQRPEREVDHSLPSNANDKNARN